MAGRQDALKQRIERMKASHAEAIADCKAHGEKRLYEAHVRHESIRADLKAQLATEVQKEVSAAAHNQVLYDALQCLQRPDVTSSHPKHIQQLEEEASKFKVDAAAHLSECQAGHSLAMQQLQEQCRQQVSDIELSCEDHVQQLQAEARQCQADLRIDLQQLQERCQKAEQERVGLQIVVQAAPHTEHDEESKAGIVYDKQVHGPACERSDAINVQHREMAVALQQLQFLATSTAQQFDNLLTKEQANDQAVEAASRQMEMQHTAEMHKLAADNSDLKSQHAAELDRLNEVAQATAAQHATQLAQLTDTLNTLKAEHAAEVKTLKIWNKNSTQKLAKATVQHREDIAKVHQQGDAAGNLLRKQLKEAKQAARQAQQQAAQDLEALNEGLAGLTAQRASANEALAAANASLVSMTAERDAGMARQESAAADLARLRQHRGVLKTQLKKAMRALEEMKGQQEASSNPSQGADDIPSCKQDAGTGSTEAQYTEASTPDRPKAADAQSAGSATPQSAEGSSSPAAEFPPASALEGTPEQSEEAPPGQEGGTSPSQPAAGPSTQPAAATASMADMGFEDPQRGHTQGGAQFFTSSIELPLAPHSTGLKGKSQATASRDGMGSVAKTQTAGAAQQSPSVKSKCTDATAACAHTMLEPSSCATPSVVPAAAPALRFGSQSDVASTDFGAQMTRPAGQTVQTVHTVADAMMEDQAAAEPTSKPASSSSSHDTATVTTSFTQLMTAASIDMDDTSAMLPGVSVDSDIPMQMLIDNAADASISSAMNTIGLDSEAVSKLGTAVPFWGQQGAAAVSLGQPTGNNQDVHTQAMVPLASDNAATSTHYDYLPDMQHEAAGPAQQQPTISSLAPTWIAPLSSSRSTAGPFKSSFLRSAAGDTASAEAGQPTHFSACSDSHAAVSASAAFGFGHLNQAAPSQKPAGPQAPQAFSANSAPFGHSWSGNSQGVGSSLPKPTGSRFGFQGAASRAATSHFTFGASFPGGPATSTFTFRSSSSCGPAQASEATHGASFNHVTGSKQQASPGAVIPEPAQGSAATAAVSGPGSGLVSGSATTDATGMSCANSAFGSSQFDNSSTTAAHSDAAGFFNFVEFDESTATPSVQPSNSSESASEKATPMQDGTASMASEREARGAFPGTSVSHAMPGSFETEAQAQSVHSIKSQTAVAAAQSGGVSQGASAADLPLTGSQNGNACMSSSSGLNVQAVQQASCSDREGRDAAVEQSDTIKAFAGTTPSPAARYTANTAPAADDPALNSPNLAGWSGFADVTQQSSVTGIGQEGAGSVKPHFKFNLGKPLRSQAAKAQAAKLFAFTPDVTEPPAMPDTANASCVQPQAAHDVVDDKASALGEDSAAVAQQTSGLLAASASSTASPSSLRRPATAAQQAKVTSATVDEGNEGTGLDALLGAIDELEGDPASDASAAATLAAMCNATARVEEGAGTSHQIGNVTDDAEAKPSLDSCQYFADPFAAVQYHSAAMRSRKPASCSQTAPAQSNQAEQSWDDVEPLPSDWFSQPGTEELSRDDFQSMANDFFAEPATAELASDAAILAGVSHRQETASEGASINATEKTAAANAPKARRVFRVRKREGPLDDGMPAWNQTSESDY